MLYILDTLINAEMHFESSADTILFVFLIPSLFVSVIYLLVA